MNRILITGGSGFIGTNLVEHYLREGVEILNLDIHPPRNTEHKRFWKKADLLDRNTMWHLVNEFNPTHVLHLAARTDLDETTSLSGYDANIEGVHILIEILKNCKTLQRVVFASSMLVCRVGHNPEHYEDYSPPNLYGESKVLTEQIIKESQISQFEWCMIRPTSMWGPWFDRPYKDFFTMISEHRFFKIAGRSSTKTFGFIGNGVFQIDRLLFADAGLVNKKTFYIGDQPPSNINEWADEIAGMLGIRLLTLPYFIFSLLALLGDFLFIFKIHFPMTSFRLRNMRTDNDILLLKDTFKVIPHLPYTRQEGTRITLEWMKKINLT